ncbi:N/A [soil metagenome]|jgi:WXG100 family type VII secretion target
MDRILYNHGMVSALSSTVGTSAMSLQSIHDDVRNQTEAIAEFFQGEAATVFRENQMLMLSAFQDLIEVMSKHGQTIETVRNDADTADKTMSNFFV